MRVDAAGVCHSDHHYMTGSANPLIDLPRLFSLYLSGRLPIDALLGRTYPLAAVNEAYAALTQGAVGRAVVVPGR